MISRITIENLVIVERAEFLPGAGLTTITGETGAGKTLLATAIRLLFGADADAGVIGAWGDEAWVEGEFQVDESFWQQPELAAFAELRPDGEDVLVLGRRVTGDGRTRALAWGRTVAKRDLASAGRQLVSMAGQHAQRKLVSPAFQRDVVDGAGGAKLSAQAAAMAAAWQSLQDARATLATLEERARLAQLESERIAAELAAIDAVSPETEDEALLLASRDRARHRDALVTAAAAASALLGEDDGAIDRTGAAYARLTEAAAYDPTFGELAEALLAAQGSLSDVLGELGGQLDSLSQGGEGSLADIEDRLAAYDELKRRFGGTTASVLAAWAQLKEDAALAGDTDALVAAARQDVTRAEGAAHAAAEKLRGLRVEAARAVEGGVLEQLASLGMADSTFEVQVSPADLSRHGSDSVELLLAPSADMRPRPLGDVASGGELSRISLALHVVAGVTEAGTVIFDEIDAGIGGTTAHAIGSLLRALGEQTQVICITHLPQVAARATDHTVIEKAGGRTTLRALGSEDEVVSELCRMLGGDVEDEAARELARGLRGPRVGGGPRTTHEQTQLVVLDGA